ncbi:MAG TPA: hypothetical protein VHP83_01015 [Aggregatilineaceae bacterium]|nr:hypothetical protein [Aggregatilineaceae bacterium]
MYRLYKPLIVLLSFLVFAACGSDKKNADTPAKPTVTPPIALPNTFTTAAGVSVQYPENWLAEELYKQIILTTSAEATTAEGVLPGQLRIAIYPPLPRSILPINMMTFTLAQRESTGFAAFPTSILSASPDMSISDMTTLFANELDEAASTLTTGGKDAARVDIAIPGTEGTVFGINLNTDKVIFVTAAAHEGEWKTFEPIVLAILATITAP